jgi:hypothetical protein
MREWTFCYTKSVWKKWRWKITKKCQERGFSKWQKWPKYPKILWDFLRLFL